MKIFYRIKKENNKNHYLLQSLYRKSRRSKNKRKGKRTNLIKPRLSTLNLVILFIGNIMFYRVIRVWYAAME